MNLNLIKFQDKGSKGFYYISITKSNNIGISSKFYEDKKLSVYKYATLYWDEALMAIGINFTKDKEIGVSFKVISSNGYGAIISAESFFKAAGIDVNEYWGKYTWTKEKVGDAELFVIMLKPKAATTSA